MSSYKKKIIVKILLSVLVSNLKYEDNMYTGAFMAMSGHLFKQIAGGWRLTRNKICNSNLSEERHCQVY